MKKINALSLIFTLAIACSTLCAEKMQITKAQLADKIKGGWAGQIIGCTYGGPTEFKFNRKVVPDNVKIAWNENQPITASIFGGLYDDIYLDVTFMDVFERYGLNAPQIEFHKAIGESDYSLWAANRAVRFAWLDGFERGKPTSWKVNPVYNDIDFQIEADFAGLMAPAMPNIAVKFAETVGRIINSNDGFYCGAYVAAMYSTAFYTSDMKRVVTEAMRILPQNSRIRRIAEYVVKWHAENPTDWKYAWQKLEDNYISKHDFNKGSTNIHAPYNCAYILIGLLYGNGDFERTAEISMRCGLDSDCNPASACGILATATGYSKISAKFTKRLEFCEDKLFMGTNYSPQKVYDTGLKQALEVLKTNGANFDGEKISVTIDSVKELPFEADAPSDGEIISRTQPIKFSGSLKIEFEGNGVILYPDTTFAKAFKAYAEAQKQKGFVGEIEVVLDGVKIRTAKFFTEKYRNKRDFVFSKRDIREGKHKLELKLVNTKTDFPEFAGYIRIFKSRK